jgi:hypothetical protein
MGGRSWFLSIIQARADLAVAPRRREGRDKHCDHIGRTLPVHSHGQKFDERLLRDNAGRNETRRCTRRPEQRRWHDSPLSVATHRAIIIKTRRAPRAKSAGPMRSIFEEVFW